MFTPVAARPCFASVVVGVFGLGVLAMAGAMRMSATAITVSGLLLVRAVSLVIVHRAGMPIMTAFVRAGFMMVMNVAGFFAIVFHTLGDGAGPPILQRSWLVVRRRFGRRRGRRYRGR